MHTKKVNPPLLYIQQPILEDHSPSMQQIFILKKPNKVKKTLEDTGQLVDQVLQNNNLEEVIENGKVQRYNAVDSLNNEVRDNLNPEEEVQVTEFILNGILSNANGGLDISESVIKKNFETQRYIEEEELILNNKSTLKTSKEIEKNIKKGRVPFNKLSLDDKLRQLKKMPVTGIKVIYEVVTDEDIFRGYYISLKNGNLLIQQQNTNDFFTIPESKLINISIVGL